MTEFTEEEQLIILEILYTLKMKRLPEILLQMRWICLMMKCLRYSIRQKKFYSGKQSNKQIN